MGMARRGSATRSHFLQVLHGTQNLIVWEGRGLLLPTHAFQGGMLPSALRGSKLKGVQTKAAANKAKVLQADYGVSINWGIRQGQKHQHW